MMDVVGSKTLEIMSNAVWYNSWLFEVVRNCVKAPILEVGGGIGNFTTLLRGLGHVTVVDIDRRYLKNLKRLNGEASSGYGDIEKGTYFFSNKKFNTLVCMNVLEHIKNDLTALKNMYKLTSGGGNLILLVPAGQFAYGSLDKNLSHFRRYSKQELIDKLKKSGYKVERIRYLNFLGIFGWWFNCRILKKKILPKNQISLFDTIARPLLILERYISPPTGLSLLVIAKKL